MQTYVHAQANTCMLDGILADEELKTSLKI